MNELISQCLALYKEITYLNTNEGIISIYGGRGVHLKAETFNKWFPGIDGVEWRPGEESDFSTYKEVQINEVKFFALFKAEEV